MSDEKENNLCVYRHRNNVLCDFLVVAIWWRV